MKRRGLFLVVAVILITATLTMMYANSRTQDSNRRQNANRPIENANRISADNATDDNNTTKIRKGKMQVKLLPSGAEGVELKEGVLRLKPGYKFDKKDDGTVSIARTSGGLGETGGTWSCACGSDGGGTCKALILSGSLSCSAGTCKDCSLDVVVGKVRTNIMRY